MTPLNSSFDFRIHLGPSEMRYVEVPNLATRGSGGQNCNLFLVVFGHSWHGTWLRALRRSPEGPQERGPQCPLPTAGARKRGAKRPEFLVYKYQISVSLPSPHTEAGVMVRGIGLQDTPYSLHRVPNNIGKIHILCQGRNLGNYRYPFTYIICWRGLCYIAQAQPSQAELVELALSRGCLSLHYRLSCPECSKYLVIQIVWPEYI